VSGGTFAPHRELGLTDAEYEGIRDRLGRDPNALELAVFSLMWSEHCAYKHSKKLLRELPTDGPHLLMGPGENAGVVDVGDGLAVAFKVESHNHPSAVEPFQGAATGVGGILRDIFAVGARPIAVLDSLRFGELESARSRYLFDWAVKGIGHYGNSIGVPTVGGEVYFEPAYEQNCLVNAMCVGLIESDRLIRSPAAGVGNVVVLFGARTGRDGIGGASVLASAELGDEDSAKRPTVQIGDPFEESKLLECSLELLDRGLLVALQDLGAAGITCALAETAAAAGLALTVAKPPASTGAAIHPRHLVPARHQVDVASARVLHAGMGEDVTGGQQAEVVGGVVDQGVADGDVSGVGTPAVGADHHVAAGQGGQEQCGVDLVGARPARDDFDVGGVDEQGAVASASVRQGGHQPLVDDAFLARHFHEASVAAADGFGADRPPELGAPVGPQHHAPGIAGATGGVGGNECAFLDDEAAGVFDGFIAALEPAADPDAAALGTAGVDLGIAPDLDLPGLDHDVAAHEPERLCPAVRHDYTIEANWKTITENYHECYHCPSIHPELCRVSPPDSSVNVDGDGAWIGGAMDLGDGAETMSLTGTSGGETMPWLDEGRRRQVHYYGVLPNLLLSLHPDYVMTHRLEPLACDRTRIVCEWLFPRELVARHGFDPSYASDFWDVTNRQDWHACEQVQRGMCSRGFVPGPLSPREDAVYRFVTFVARSYLDGHTATPAQLDREL
jgi:hydrogenase maturation factor